MKRFARRAVPVLALCVTSLGLGGCAGLGSAVQNDYVVDSAKVAQVERAAQRYGIGLVWISPPLKKIAPAGG